MCAEHEDVLWEVDRLVAVFKREPNSSAATFTVRAQCLTARSKNSSIDGGGARFRALMRAGRNVRLLALIASARPLYRSSGPFQSVKSYPNHHRCIVRLHF